MAESAGSIYYEVDANTQGLVDAEQKAKDSVDRMVAALDRNTAALGKNERELSATAKGVRAANRELNEGAKAWSALTKAVTAYIGLRTLQWMAQLSDQYGQYASRIRNATSSTEEYEKVQARLLETANGTYRSLNEAQEVYLSVADVLKGLGYSTEEVLDVTDSLSYAFVRDAARADQAQSAMDAYSKALQKGKIDADAWASILAATPSIVEGISEATGRSAEEIRKLGATGKLSTEALNEGLRRSRDENKRLADEMETSTKDATIQLGNAFQVFFGKANEAAGASSIFTENVKLLSDALQDPATIQAAVDLSTGVVNALNTIIDALKTTVGIAKWAGESIAAALHGAASDDIVRLEDQLQTYQAMLDNPLRRLRIGGKGQAVALFSEEEIKANIAATQKLIDQFYKNQENRGPIIQPPPPPPVTPPTGRTGTVAAEAPDTAAGKKAATAAAREKAKAERDEAKAVKENADAVKALAVELSLANLKGQELAQAQAVLKLNQYATPEQIEQVRALASELERVEARKAAQKKFGDDPAAKIRGTVTPLSGGMFDDQLARYQAEEEAENERYAAQLERLRAAKAAEIELVGGYQALELQMAQEHAARLAQIDQAKNQVMLQSGEQLFGSLADVTKQFAGEQSGIYKVMFAAQKAFGIAQSLVAIQTGIAMAAANPWPVNLGAMASVAAATASLVSNISSITMGSGKQYGGNVSAGKGYRINETGKPEIFNAANGQQYMLPNTRGQVVSNKDATGGGAPNVKVINNGAPVNASARMNNGELEVILSAVDDYMAGQFASGKGKTARAARQNNVMPRRIR